jgi:hypothetical protein
MHNRSSSVTTVRVYHEHATRCTIHVCIVRVHETGAHQRASTNNGIIIIIQMQLEYGSNYFLKMASSGCSLSTVC